jgi:Protein of unknown function (DUF3305)
MRTPPETETRRVGVIVERRAVDNPWVDHSWRPVQVLDGVPESPAWTKVSEGEGWQRFYAGPAELVLYRHETENYKFNLDGRMPSIWVFLRRSPEARGIDLHGASCDPGEAQAHNDTGDDIVDAVPMPEAIQAWVSDYVARHPPHTFTKRQRVRAEPEALARHLRLYQSDPHRQVPEDE